MSRMKGKKYSKVLISREWDEFFANCLQARDNLSRSLISKRISAQFRGRVKRKFGFV